MLIQALSDPLTIGVLGVLAAGVVAVVVMLMICLAAKWMFSARRQSDVFRGGLTELRRVGRDLPPEHPIRKRLESARVVDVSFEEIAHLLSREGAGGAAEELVKLRNHLSWIERFAQLAIYLGIFGTVFALVMSDPTDLTAFRSQLPTALLTTFIGLIGAIVLSVLAGMVESRIENAAQLVRNALLEGFDGES